MEQILYTQRILVVLVEFPISRDPPEGGTVNVMVVPETLTLFPISRDPPEGGTGRIM